jgi:hypothetical protein
MADSLKGENKTNFYITFQISPLKEVLLAGKTQQNAETVNF